MSDFLTEMHPIALEIAGHLRGRGEKLAVADGASGGLIMASLLTVPGALDFFLGGGVVYSFKARDVLFDLPRGAYDGMQPVSEQYAMFQARAIAARLGAQWGIAESGSAGASKHPRGIAGGRSVAAIHGANAAGGDFEQCALVETGSDDRITNMHAFARNALRLAARTLANAPA